MREPNRARPRLYSIDEAAYHLGIAAGTLRNWISMRRIDYVKVGRLTKISQTAIDSYIAAHTVPAEHDTL